MKSKTKIDSQLIRKGNDSLALTIISAKKNDAWLPVASILASSRRTRPSLNLDEINEQAKDGETVLVPGKILSVGEVTKKIKLVALGFSEKAREKLLKSKIQISNIADEIKHNPDAKGLRVLTGK